MSEIKEADSLQIISLVDNSVDLLSTIERKGVYSYRQWQKKRSSKGNDNAQSHLPFAEHGFSMFARPKLEGNRYSALFDTGNSPNSVIENATRMGLNIEEIDAIVLSHGHYDHSGGLLSLLNHIKKADLPVIVHEDMFRTRGTASRNGIRAYPQFPTEQQLKKVKLIKTKKPQLFFDDMLLVTGEIPRETDFEKGNEQHKSFEDKAWTPDPLIWDDRAIVINVKQKGLVVITGCAHAGIVNTVRYAQRITGVKTVHAILGGFHLAGKDNENRIVKTVKALQEIKPKLIAPSHCTGWRGILSIAHAFPDAFVWNSVGNLYEI